MTMKMTATTKTSDLWIAFDFETSNQNPYTCTIDRVCLAQFNITTGIVFATWDFRMNDRDISDLRKLMASACPKVAHNAAFDLHLMEERLGMPIKGVLHDTRLMAKHWKNDLPAFDLKSLAWWLVGDLYLPLRELRQWIHEQNMKGEDPDEDIHFDMTQCPDKLVHKYCLHDCNMTAQIAHVLYPQIKDNYAYQLDTRTIRRDHAMRNQGIAVDLPLLRRIAVLGKRRIKRNIQQAKEVIEKVYDVDLGKRKPTGNALRSHVWSLGEKRKTKTGLISTSEPVLRDWKADEAVRAVLRVRRDQKTVGTYAENLLQVAQPRISRLNPDIGYFHPGFIQSGAITLRYRASGMYGDNGIITKGQVQNIPRGPGIRSSFIVPPGYWFTKLDLASIEARKFSAYMDILMGESTFADMYRKDDHFNVYVLVLRECADIKDASKKHELYTPYKHGTLARLYGSSAARFSVQLRDDFDLDYTKEDCEDIFGRIDKRFPFIRKFQRFVSNLAQVQGYIRDPYGMVYHIPQEELFKAVAYLCQGSAGFTLKEWWERLDGPMKKFGWIDHIFMTVHDEFDVAISKAKGKRDAKKRVKAYCQAARDIDIFGLPIIAEASDLEENWADAG